MNELELPWTEIKAVTTEEGAASMIGKKHVRWAELGNKVSTFT
jgi:hypothetical protein